MDGGHNKLRHLPAVSAVLQEEPALRLLSRYSHQLVAEAAASLVARARRELLLSPGDEVPDGIDLSPAGMAKGLEAEIKKWTSPSLRRVVNATGVVLHTNLGRSPLADGAVQAVAEAARGYCNLEYDLDQGTRGSRHDHVCDLLCRLTEAEAALVVNNNAAAVLLTLSALAASREVVVSRGELVEIGGSFRIPEIMAQSGAILREVGCTNKTRLADYEGAINDKTALLLKVHTSNYRIIGFTEEASLEDLAGLGARHSLPVVNDLGSGVLLDLTEVGLPGEPTVQASLAAGADLVTFSGDKLLGGPQAGIAVGRKFLVERLQKHPLARALRIDKLTLAALEATLKLYLDPSKVTTSIPTLRMLSRSFDEIEGAAQRLAAALRSVSPSTRVKVVEGFSQVGGGALPLAQLPTRLVALQHPNVSPVTLEAELRRHEPPVIARIHRDLVLLDPRTLLPGDDEVLVQAIRGILSGGTRSSGTRSPGGSGNGQHLRDGLGTKKHPGPGSS